MGNIVENPHIGMIFVDFFDSTVGLHVNGKVRIFLDQKISGLFPDAIKNEVPKRSGLKAQCWVIVEIDEAYIHCSKHVPKLKKMKKEILVSLEIISIILRSFTVLSSNTLNFGNLLKMNIDHQF